MGLRRHVAELPVMLAHAALRRQTERAIGVMAGLIDLVDQRRSAFAALCIPAVTDRA